MKEIRLVCARADDAQCIHEMKYRAFLPLYEKYRDGETSPATEKLEKVQRQLAAQESAYFLIEADGETVGAIRVARDGLVDGLETCRVSPLFVLPEHQGKGVGFAAMQRALALFPQAQRWRLATIKEEAGNCRLYEKCGFVRTGEREVNERMTLVFYEKKGTDIG
ncbi:MAG: GNAT family N-acetyltransferase [Eubacteriales bacterium]|nr:GNAT family N-acetyltransferase [Eubacteriales bacterium]